MGIGSAASVAQAANQYWDTNGNTSGVGGSGDWSTTVANWSASSGGGSTVVWNNASPTAAYFGGTAGTVTLQEAISATQLQFSVNNNNYTISGSPLLTLSQYPQVTASSTTTTIDAPVLHLGTHFLVDGTNSSLIFNNTVDRVGSANATLQLRVKDNSKVVFNQSVNLNRLQLTTESTDSSRVELNAANTFSVGSTGAGGLTGNRGAFVLGHDNAAGAATITLQGSGVAATSASLLLKGNRTISNALEVIGTGGFDTLGQDDAGTSTFSGTIKLWDNTRGMTLSAATSGRLNVESSIFTTGAITKAGNGIVSLDRPAGNTYTGGTAVTAGTLLVNNTTGSGTGTNTVAVSAGTLGGSGSISGAVNIIGTGTLAPGNSPGILGTGNLSLTGATTTYAVDITGAGTILFGTACASRGPRK